MYESNSFTGRLNKLLQDSNLTREEFAKRCQVSGSALTNYLNGSRTPDAAKLKPICEEFSVSADWLLGLSDVRMPSTDLKAVVEYTGLSEAAINIIVKLSQQKELSNAFSNMIEKPEFPELIEKYYKYLELAKKIRERNSHVYEFYKGTINIETGETKVTKTAEIKEDGNVELNMYDALFYCMDQTASTMKTICDEELYQTMWPKVIRYGSDPYGRSHGPISDKPE